MKKVEDMTSVELEKLLNEKREKEWDASITHTGYLKHDLYDYDPDGVLCDMSYIGESKEEIDKHVASDLAKVAKELPKCVILSIKKGTKFFKREGYWQIEETEEVLGDFDCIDLNDKWAKKNLIITKIKK